MKKNESGSPLHRDAENLKFEFSTAPPPVPGIITQLRPSLDWSEPEGGGLVHAGHTKKKKSLKKDSQCSSSQGS